MIFAGKCFFIFLARFFASPITNFSVGDVVFDFDNNQTLINVSWSPPHDVDDSKVVTDYLIYSNGSKLQLISPDIVVSLRYCLFPISFVFVSAAIYFF